MRDGNLTSSAAGAFTSAPHILADCAANHEPRNLPDLQAAAPIDQHHD
jgi:hypothetical protein